MTSTEGQQVGPRIGCMQNPRKSPAKAANSSALHACRVTCTASLSKEEPNDENGGRSQKLDKRANTYHALARTVANMHAIQK